MATKKKSSSKDSQPSVPEAQMISIDNLKQPTEMARPEYEPFSLNDFSNWTNKAYQLQLQYAPQVIDAQKQAQTALYNNMVGLNLGAAPQYASLQNQLLAQYNPEFRQQYAQQGTGLSQLDSDVGYLGNIAKKNLSYGYSLGDELSREVEQSIRGAQTARGNWLGAAPTAAEAMGKGSAMIDLYNNRYNQYNQYLGQKQGAVGARQTYLQGQNPIDMMAKVGAASQMGASYYPSQSYVDGGLGVQGMGIAQSGMNAFNSTVQAGYSTYQGALQNYNQNAIGATAANNEAMFGQYDRTAESWMYREAVRQGLYQTPSTGGGGAGGSGMMGKAIGGIGAGVSTGIGLAAAGASTGLATAGGAAAAASAAAAALCWVAQKAIPERWQQFRKWLCTKASPEFRKAYIFTGRRIANSMTTEDIEYIKPLMLSVL